MSKQQRTSFFSKLIGVIAFTVACIALVCSTAAFISPRVFWLPAVFGLGFQFAFLLNLFFVLLLAIRKKKLLFFLLIPSVIGATTFIDSFNFTDSKSVAVKPNSFKIMSYNVRLFDLYNWSHNAETRAKIFRMLQSEKPDIVCFQEFFSEDIGKFNNADTLTEVLNLPYKYIEYTTTVKNNYHWGIATYSRYPIIKKGNMVFGKNKNPNNCIYTDLVINQDTVRLFNTHLESIRFKKADYEYIENITENDEEEKLTGGKKILFRLKRAFEKRAAEADTLALYISKSPYPTLLCGDFNDTPASYAYKTISAELCDAFKHGDQGFGSTYNGAFPAFRIDYILYSKSFNCYNFNLKKENLSDHYPISCWFELNK